MEIKWCYLRLLSISAVINKKDTRDPEEMELSQITDLLAWRKFDRRLEKSRDALYRMAFSWCHNRYLAEDLTQQTLVKALEKRNQLRDLDKLERWVFQILANALRDWYRRERTTEDIEDHEPVDGFGIVEERFR